MVKEYMVKVYAYMVKANMRAIETLPEQYQEAVALHLAEQEERA